MPHDFTTYRQETIFCVECGQPDLHPSHTPSVHIIKLPPPHAFQRPPDFRPAQEGEPEQPFLCFLCGCTLDHEVHKIGLNLNPETSREEFFRAKEAQATATPTPTPASFENIQPRERRLWDAVYIAAISGGAGPKQGKEDQRTNIGIAARCANLALEKHRELWSQDKPQPIQKHAFVPDEYENFWCFVCQHQKHHPIHKVTQNLIPLHDFIADQKDPILCFLCHHQECDPMHDMGNPQPLPVVLQDIDSTTEQNNIFLVGLSGDDIGVLGIGVLGYQKLAKPLTPEQALNLARYLRDLAEIAIEMRETLIDRIP